MNSIKKLKLLLTKLKTTLMKRLVSSILFLTIFTVSYSQNLTSKKGENYLPEDGDWAIGLDATTFLNYAGNLINSGASAPTIAEPLFSQTIYAKLFTSNNEALRATLGINLLSNTDNSNVDGLESDGQLSGSKVINSVKESSTLITLGLGKEFRRGSTRLQGFYGADAFVMLGSSSTTNTYGNSIKSEALNNGTTSRDLVVKDGSTFGLMIRGFLGAEYFIAPKISISAELGWGVGLSSSGDGSISSESYDFGDNSSSNSSTTSPGDSSFNITNDLGISQGVLGLNLHF